MGQKPDLKNWYRDNYLVSTNRSLLQLDAINDAFGSGLMFWTKKMDEEHLKSMADNSLCLGLYILPESTSDIAGRESPRMIGLSRVITDYTTFGYLTDVYVLPEYQGKGLASWMMKCLDEMLEQWDDLRRFMLITSSDQAVEFYRKALGAQLFVSHALRFEAVNERYQQFAVIISDKGVMRRRQQ